MKNFPSGTLHSKNFQKALPKCTTYFCVLAHCETLEGCSWVTEFCCGIAVHFITPQPNSRYNFGITKWNSTKLSLKYKYCSNWSIRLTSNLQHKVQKWNINVIFFWEEISVGYSYLCTFVYGTRTLKSIVFAIIINWF